MKAYQLKIIRKKSKPPVWRRCIIPSGITFSQLVLILAQITEETPTEDYEFEFFQAGMHLREWGEDRPTVRKWNYDYLCASDSFIDTFLDAEGWFTFRTGSGGEYRAEIEKSLPQEKSFPFIVKQSGKPESRMGRYGGGKPPAAGALYGDLWGSGLQQLPTAASGTGKRRLRPERRP